MRKILTALACVGVTLSLLPAFMAPAHALDVSIGPAVWYAWWTPAFWKEWSRGDADDTVTKRDFNSTFLFGPALAVSFSPKWSLTGVFMWTGWYRAEKTKIDVGDNERSEDSLDISKYDLDTALNYTINRYCKLFGGVKYQGYTYRDRGKDYDLTTGVLLDSYSNRLLAFNRPRSGDRRHRPALAERFPSGKCVRHIFVQRLRGNGGRFR